MQPVCDVWVAWTERSAAVPFTSTTKGVGNGEHKIAAEIECGAPHGQNSPYDLDIPALQEPKADVKELDGGTFNTGVNGRDALRPIKAHLATLLDILLVLGEDAAVSADIREMISTLNKKKEKSPDEICVAAVRQIGALCVRLNLYRGELMSATRRFNVFDVLTGAPREVSADEMYRLAVASGKSQSEVAELLGADYVSAKSVVESLSHPFVLEPDRLQRDLTGLVSVFRGYTLVFVNETKGYYIMTMPETKIEFQRITRGSARFKVSAQFGAS